MSLIAMCSLSRINGENEVYEFQISRFAIAEYPYENMIYNLSSCENKFDTNEFVERFGLNKSCIVCQDENVLVCKVDKQQAINIVSIINESNVKNTLSVKYPLYKFTNEYGVVLREFERQL